MNSVIIDNKIEGKRDWKQVADQCLAFCVEGSRALD